MGKRFRDLLPRHKSDSERVKTLIELGYPAVAPILSELLTWVRDGNWPISHSIGSFLASVGEPMVPLIRDVFRGNDDIWKYWCLVRVVMKMTREVVEQLRPDIERLVESPTKNERTEEVDDRALETHRMAECHQELTICLSRSTCVGVQNHVTAYR